MEPEDRPTVDEIMQNEWFNSAYNEDTPQILFEEMEQRKLYMFDHARKKNESDKKCHL